MKLLRRFFVFIGIVLTAVLLSSCAEQPKIPDISTVLDNNAAIAADGQTYDCHINYVSPTTAAITFNAPDTIKNMTVRRADGQYSLSLGSLICRTDTSLLDDTSVLMRAVNVLDGITKSQNVQFRSADENKFTFTVGVGNDNVTVVTDRKGAVKNIKASDIQISVK